MNLLLSAKHVFGGMLVFPWEATTEEGAGKHISAQSCRRQVRLTLCYLKWVGVTGRSSSELHQHHQVVLRPLEQARLGYAEPIWRVGWLGGGEASVSERESGNMSYATWSAADKVIVVVSQILHVTSRILHFPSLSFHFIQCSDTFIVRLSLLSSER